MELNLNEEKNEILGELDHLNSLIGLAKSFVQKRNITKLLTGVQNDLFVIQANVADAQSGLNQPSNITENRILDLEGETNKIERGLKKLNHFVLPEGTTAACALHCARTTARKIERKIPNYLKDPTVIAVYFDRLACLMFALARQINHKNGFTERAPSYTKREQLTKGEQDE